MEAPGSRVSVFSKATKFAAAFSIGIADAGWTAFGLIVGTYLNWLFIAKRLRNYTAEVDAITIPDYFKKRFEDNSNIILCIGALFILVFFVPYTASGFSACGKLFSSLFGVNYQLAMIVSAVIIVGYTTTGGFLAASKTDFIQSIVMTIALFFVVGYGIVTAGGISAVMENISSLPGFINVNATYNNATNSASPYGLFSKVTMFCWGLGYFGMPHILLRFMAIRNASELKLSRRIASVWVVFSLSIAVFLGVVGRAMSQSGALRSLIDNNNLSSSAKAETLIVVLAQKISELIRSI